MNSYIKHIIEAFDFNNINKQKKSINAYDKLLSILEKIKKSDFDKISEDEYDILISFTAVYKVSDRRSLKKLIIDFIEYFGYKCNLNWIDVSNITNMDNLFEDSEFTGDISQWDVSNVTTMDMIFCGSKFNGDISNWDVSNVKNMGGMFFYNSVFNGDISKWNTSSATDMSYLFNKTTFNGDISNWNVSNVLKMERMFQESEFNNDISKWDVSNVIDMSWMFYKSKFNNNISDWNVSNVTTMEGMFDDSQFNSDISKWDVSNVINMHSMFSKSKFNSDISKWDVSNVKTMDTMFFASQFNNDISNWDVSNVSNRQYLPMFNQCPIKDEYKPNLYIEEINEAFEFGSINKQKKSINVINVIKSQLAEIIKAIDNTEDLTQEQYEILCMFPGVYKVKYTQNLKIQNLMVIFLNGM